MGLKENFSQAVRELTGGGKEEDKKKTSQASDLKKVMDDEATAEDARTEFASAPYYRETPVGQQNGQQPQHDFSGQSGFNQQQNGFNQQSGFNQQGGYGQPGTYGNTYSQPLRSEPNPQGFSGQTYDRYGVNGGYNNGYNGGYGSYMGSVPPMNGPSVPPMSSNPARGIELPDDEELTVISKNTIIDGNVRSFANMNIDGDIKGDVETTKNVNLNGKIVGDITCNNACMLTSKIQGNVHLKGAVRVERDTLLIGDLSSTFATINGKVKGNVEIAGKAEFKADAVIFGDISASTITVDDGAIIQGYVSTTFLSKDESASIFPDAITIGE